MIVGVNEVADPPMIEHVLLEQPLEVCAVLGIAGAVLLIVGRYRDDSRLIKAGVAGLGVGVLVYGLSWAIETGRERLIGLTEHLVRSTCPLDVAELEAGCDPKATVCGPEGEVWVELNDVFRRLKRLDAERPITEQQITLLRAETDGRGGGKTLVDLATKLDWEYPERPFLTRWVMHWSKGDDGRWRVVKVQWLRHPSRFGFQPKRMN